MSKLVFVLLMLFAFASRAKKWAAPVVQTRVQSVAVNAMHNAHKSCAFEFYRDVVCGNISGM